MNYSERTHPKVYKSLIDSAWIEMAKISGADAGKADNILNEITLVSLEEGKSGPFQYLQETAGKLKDVIYTEKTNSLLKGDWFRTVLNGTTGELPVFSGAERDEEGSDEEGNSVFLENYPSESHEALKQDNYLAGADADVLGLWKTDNGTKIFHAHPEGFWILGEDPADWINKTVQKIKERA